MTTASNGENRAVMTIHRPVRCAGRRSTALPLGGSRPVGISPLNSADLPAKLSYLEVLPEGQDDHWRCKRSDKHRNRQNEHDHLPCSAGNLIRSIMLGRDEKAVMAVTD